METVTLIKAFPIFLKLWRWEHSTDYYINMETVTLIKALKIRTLLLTYFVYNETFTLIKAFIMFVNL